ncbi:hypothetical protein V3595_22035 [Bacillus sp. CFBP9009]
MSQDEEYYSNDGGMVSDSATRRPNSSKTKIPKFKWVTKKVPPTEFGAIMGNLTLGMLFVFPAIALLTMEAPKVIFSIIGIIFLFTWLSSSIRFALIILGLCLAVVLLGFVSIGFYMMLLG